MNSNVWAARIPTVIIPFLENRTWRPPRHELSRFNSTRLLRQQRPAEYFVEGKSELPAVQSSTRIQM
jgi:hypothetical protein